MSSRTQSPSMLPTEKTHVAASPPASTRPAPAAASTDAAKAAPVGKAAPVAGPQYDKSYGYKGKDCEFLLSHRKHDSVIDEANVRRMKNLLFAPTHAAYRTLPATMGHAPTTDELDGVWSVLPFVLRDNTKFSRPVVAALFQPWENAMNETVSESRLVYMVYGTDTTLKPQLVMHHLDSAHSEALSANMIVYKPSKSEWCHEAFVDYQAARVILELEKQLRGVEELENSELRIPSDAQAVAKVVGAVTALNLRVSLLVFAGCDSKPLDADGREGCVRFAAACNREYAAGDLTRLLGRLAFGPSAPAKPAKPVHNPVHNPVHARAAPAARAGGSASNTLVFVPSHKQGSASGDVPVGCAGPDEQKKRPVPPAQAADDRHQSKKKSKRAAPELDYSDKSLSSDDEDDDSNSPSSEESATGSDGGSDDEHSVGNSESGSGSSSKSATPTPRATSRSKQVVKKPAVDVASASTTGSSAAAAAAAAAATLDHEECGAPRPATWRTAKDRRTQIVDKGMRALAVLDQVGDLVPIAHASRLTEKIAAVRNAHRQYGTVGKVDEHTNLIMELTELVFQLGNVLVATGTQKDTAPPSARLLRGTALSLAKVYLTEAPAMEKLSADLTEAVSQLTDMRAARLRVVQEAERAGAQLNLLPPAPAQDARSD